MINGTPTLMATPFARLPESYHFKGEPTEWVKMTRPGQRLSSFFEGPCFDDDGNLWLVDIPYGRLFKINPQGIFDLAYAYDGEPHTIKHSTEQGFLLTDYKKGLLKFDPQKGKMDVLYNNLDGQPFLGLSDLIIAENGDVWFTDSGRTSLSDPRGRLYRYHPDTGMEMVLDMIPYPNGVTLLQDQSNVLVAATRANAIWKLSSQRPASGPPMVGTWVQLSGGLGPDGMATSKTGYIAVAQAQAGRAYVFDAWGDPVCTVKVPEGSWTTAVTFDPQRPERLMIVEAQTATIYETILDLP